MPVASPGAFVLVAALLEPGWDSAPRVEGRA